MRKDPRLCQVAHCNNTAVLGYMVDENKPKRICADCFGKTPSELKRILKLKTKDIKQQEIQSQEEVIQDREAV